MKEFTTTSLRLENHIYKKVKYISDYYRRSQNQQLLVIIEDFVKKFEEVNGTIKIDEDKG